MRLPTRTATPPSPARAALLERLESLRQIDTIADVSVLPNDTAEACWNAIHIDADDKKRLVRHALATLELRGKVPIERLPLHGIIILVGPPGTGKTTLARGLGYPVASLTGDMIYLEVNAHKLGSGALGRTQKQVDSLFTETIPVAIGDDPALIVVDEVEVLATARAKLSLDANPIDVHRAVDAALVGIDRLAREHPKALIVATTNFATAIDDAFLSRADLVLQVPPPNLEGRKLILRDTLEAVDDVHPLPHLLDEWVISRVAAAADGIDGRQLRKAVVAAIARGAATAKDYGGVTEVDLLSAVAEVLSR